MGDEGTQDTGRADRPAPMPSEGNDASSHSGSSRSRISEGLVKLLPEGPIRFFGVVLVFAEGILGTLALNSDGSTRTIIAVGVVLSAMLAILTVCLLTIRGASGLDVPVAIRKLTGNDWRLLFAIYSNPDAPYGDYENSLHSSDLEMVDRVNHLKKAGLLDMPRPANKEVHLTSLGGNWVATATAIINALNAKKPPQAPDISV